MLSNIRFLVAAIAVPASLAAQTTLALSSSSVTAGSAVSLNLSLTAPAGSAPAAVQWRLSASSALNGMIIAPGPVLASANKTLSCRENSPGVQTCIASGLNTTAIGNGVVAIVRVTPSATGTLTVSNQLGASPAGASIAMTASGGTVTVIDPAPVPALTSLACTPSSVIGGPNASSQCTVTVTTAPASGGFAVALASTTSSPTLMIPASITVPQGSTTAAFTAGFGTVTSTTSVSITASAAGVSRSATVIVNPAPAGTPASAAFVRADSATKGSWKGVYAAEGYTIANHATQLPAGVQISPTGGALTHTWATTTTDVRALQYAAGTGRVASAWYHATSLQFDINLTDGKQHHVAVYGLDFDNLARAQRVEVVDSLTGAVLDTRQMNNLSSGEYLVWQITGHVLIRVIRTAGPNAVISAVFLGVPTPASSATATFLRTDTTTRGDWTGIYGKQGYDLAGETSAPAAWATITPPPASVAPVWTWTRSTSDVRALQRPSGIGRFASTWNAVSTFSFGVDITDGGVHQLALYMVDFDNYARSQRIEVIDAATSAVLDSRNVSGFDGGQYLVWQISGRLQIRVTGANAVVSGLFLDTGSAGVPTPASITAAGGSSQATVVATAFGSPLRARVLNSSAQPVAGITVTFTAPASGASATFSGSGNVATAITDASGNATSPVVIANGTAGTFAITASVAGLSPTTFTLTNNSPSTLPPPSGAISIFGNTTPPNRIFLFGGPVELGMRLRSSVAGRITGIRFYKSSMDGGTHTGSLWASDGRLLATGSFSNETPGGWQTLTLSSPVAIAANTTYVVSVNTSSGVATVGIGYFSAGGASNGPLVAPQDSLSEPNGLSVEGTGGKFPNNASMGNNYWVDVVFVQ